MTGPIIRTLRHGPLVVEIASDQIWFTVYEAGSDEPMGTIERPHMGHDCWESYTCGGASTGRSVMASQALRKLAIALGHA